MTDATFAGVCTFCFPSTSKRLGLWGCNGSHGCPSSHTVPSLIFRCLNIAACKLGIQLISMAAVLYRGFAYFRAHHLGDRLTLHKITHYRHRYRRSDFLTKLYWTCVSLHLCFFKARLSGKEFCCKFSGQSRQARTLLCLHLTSRPIWTRVSVTRFRSKTRLLFWALSKGGTLDCMRIAVRMPSIGLAAYHHAERGTSSFAEPLSWPLFHCCRSVLSKQNMQRVPFIHRVWFQGRDWQQQTFGRRMDS